MTVESSNNKSGPFIASGATGVFPRNFLVFDPAHVRVVRSREGVEADITAGISHSGMGAASGTVTLTQGIQSGDRITLLRNMPNVQRSDYSAQSSVPTDQVELDFDLLAMQVQDLAERQRRALTLPVDSTQSGEEAMRAALAAPRYALEAKAAALEVSTAADILRNVRQYGSAGDGIANDAPAFQAAIDMQFSKGGGTVLVPSEVYLISSPITLRSNVSVIGLGWPELRFGSGIRMFQGVGIKEAEVTGFRVDGNGQTTGSFVRLENTKGCKVRGNVLTNCPSSDNGSIHVFGSTGAENNEVSDNIVTASVGNAIGLIGSGCRRNRVDGNSVTDCNGFGVFVAGGAHRNTITRNRTTSNEIELVGITVGSNHNIIANNHAEGCGDNGISVTGNYNVVVGNHCYANDLSGIFLYGSFNTATGNVCMRNGQVTGAHAGIAIQPVFGGTGQSNMVSGNVCDDDQATLTQTNSIRIMSSSYAAWAAGQAIAVGAYRVNGVRVYKAATAGTTGSTAPTHISGTVSDGGVQWESVNAFRGAEARTLGNVVLGNVYGRSSGDAVLDQQNEAPGLISMRSRIGAGLSVNRREVTASTLVGREDYILGVRTTAAVTITLPAAGTLEPGRQIIIADEYGAAATNNITISGNGANINGAGSLVLNQNHAVRHLYWTGTAWVAK